MPFLSLCAPLSGLYGHPPTYNRIQIWDQFKFFRSVVGNLFPLVKSCIASEVHSPGCMLGFGGVKADSGLGHIIALFSLFLSAVLLSLSLSPLLSRLIIPERSLDCFCRALKIRLRVVCSPRVRSDPSLFKIGMYETEFWFCSQNTEACPVCNSKCYS